MPTVSLRPVTFCLTLYTKWRILGQIYTNHSIRATTVHVLDSAEIPSHHIMAVAGHKAESSLNIKPFQKLMI
jgi:hypothetical protein